MTLPSSTCNLAPIGKLSPSGNCTSRTGAWVSLGTRMLTSTISCPVLVRTAVCSIAHSGGALRLALVHRAAQPGGGGALAGGGCAGGGALLDSVACRRSPRPGDPLLTQPTTASF